MRSALKLTYNRRSFLNERGAALVLVLWIFIFLFVVAFDFSASVREEATAARRYRDDAQGYYLALAGFERGIYEFLQRPSRAEPQQRDRPADLFDGSWLEGALGDGVYRVRLVDEGGKVNVNRADEQTLRQIFANLGVQEPRRTILVDSILDWRDQDDLHRLNGAESDYYLSLSPPYTSRNGPFDTVEDLLWVRGMTPALFFGYEDNEAGPADGHRRAALGDIFTVDSPMDRINLRTASAEVIHALLGIPLEKSRDFVEERRKHSDKTLADLLQLLGIGAGDAALRLFVFTTSAVIAVEAEGKHGGADIPRRVKGVVRMVGGSRGFEIVRWVDRNFSRRQ